MPVGFDEQVRRAVERESALALFPRFRSNWWFEHPPPQSTQGNEAAIRRVSTDKEQ